MQTRLFLTNTFAHILACLPAKMLLEQATISQVLDLTDEGFISIVNDAGMATALTIAMHKKVEHNPYAAPDIVAGDRVIFCEYFGPPLPERVCTIPETGRLELYIISFLHVDKPLTQ